MDIENDYFDKDDMVDEIIIEYDSDEDEDDDDLLDEDEDDDDLLDEDDRHLIDKVLNYHNEMKLT